MPIESLKSLRNECRFNGHLIASAESLFASKKKKSFHFNFLADFIFQKEIRNPFVGCDVFSSKKKTWTQARCHSSLVFDKMQPQLNVITRQQFSLFFFLQYFCTSRNILKWIGKCEKQIIKLCSLFRINGAFSYIWM